MSVHLTPAQAAFWTRARSKIGATADRFTPGKYRCPVCGRDKGAGLKVGYDDREHEVTFNCFGGCHWNDVRKALGVNWRELRDYAHPKLGTPAGQFAYVDETGYPQFRVSRWRDPAGQRYELRDEHGDWVISTGKRPALLYHADAVAGAIEAEEQVYLCASEADADAVRAHGGVGTATPEAPGKGGFRTEYAEALRGAYVRVVAVKTEAGRERAHLVAAALSGRAADASVVEPATSKPGATATDHLD